MDAVLQRIWYGRSLVARMSSWLLLPLSLLFAIISLARRLAFRFGLLSITRVSKPVIVVGNISVGGTGKTPIVIWLAQELTRRGYKPAVITRGYGGAAAIWPQRVTPDSDPYLVGDESVLIAQRCGALVVAGPRRVSSAQEAIAAGADVIISDDGLQHYSLARDFEIAVIDGERGVGNGYLLPAGPLRERASRLDSVQAVLVTDRGGSNAASNSLMHLRPSVRVSVVSSRIRTAVSLQTREQRPLAAFAGSRVHAVAGIGNPEAFFAALRVCGIEVEGRALADHAALTEADLRFGDDAPVLMTEKDAVKCSKFVDSRHWSVPVELQMEDAEQLLTMIESSLQPKN